MAHRVLFVGPSADPNYTRVVFLDPVGERGGAWVVAKLAQPMKLERGRVLDRDGVTELEVNKPFVGSDGEVVSQYNETKVLLNGQRECELAGDITEITVDGETVWTKGAK